MLVEVFRYSCGQLYMHPMRANFQSGVWRRCHESQPHVPNPEGRGWQKDQDATLTTEWMRPSPPPDAVIALLSCKCARECKLLICTCLVHGRVCTDMCNFRHVAIRKGKRNKLLNLAQTLKIMRLTNYLPSELEKNINICHLLLLQQVCTM